MMMNKQAKLSPFAVWWVGVLFFCLAADRGFAASPTVVRLVGTTIGGGQSGIVSVFLDATGNESALGFSINFDSSRLALGNVSLGPSVASATLNINSLQAANGRLGIVVGVSPGQAFSAGSLELVRISFVAIGGGGSVPLTFGDVPVVREVSDRQARPLTTTFTEANVRINTPPSATNQSVTTDENAPKTITLTASDPDGDGLSFSIVSNPTRGTLSGSPPNLTYTPSANLNGPDSFTFRANDGLVDSDVATVSINVNSVNSPPTLGAISNQSIAEGSNLSFTAAASDSDVPPDALVFSLDGGAPPGATINPSTGVFNWTPSEAQGPGTYTITVRVTDNGIPNLSATRSFSVTVSEVNQPPVFPAIPSQTVNEGSLLTVAAAAIDPDLPPQTLNYSLGSGAPSGASIDSSTGIFSWTPSEAQGPGTYTITVRVADNGPGNLSATQSFTVVVNEVNTLPVLAPIPDQSVKGGETLSVTPNASDADLPPQALTFSLPFGSPNGSSIDPNSGVFSWPVPLTQPAGIEFVSIQVTDSAGGSAIRSFTIAVSSSNLAPVLAVIPNQTVNEGQLLSVTVNATDPNAPVQRLSFSLEPSAPLGVSIDPNTGVISWTPTEAQGPGTYTIGVRVTDDGLPPLSDNKSFTVTVNEVNVPPVLAAVANQTVDEGKLLTVNLSATDADLPAQRLTFSLDPGAPPGLNLNPATGVITWTPTETQGPGTYTIAVRVSDDGVPSLSDAKTFTVNVNDVNAPPVLAPVANQTVDEGKLLSVTLNATDSNLPAQRLTFTLDPGAPPGVSVDAATGVLTWTPTEAQGPGVYAIGVRVTDSGAPPLSDTKTINVTVNEVNAPPTIANVSSQTVAEGTELTFTVSATDSDLPPQTVRFTLGPGAPPGISIDSTSGVVRWTPTEAQGPGTYTVVIQATDNGSPAARSTQNVTINVTEVNRPPVLAAVPNQSIAQGDNLKLEMKATDEDLPRNTLTFTIEGAPVGASIDAASGVFTWTPTAAQAPSQNTVTVRVTDNGVPPLNDAKTFSIAVRQGVNVPPTISQISSQTTFENTPTAAIAFTITDPDTPLDTLKVSAVSANPSLIPTENILISGTGANRTVTITPALNQTGTANITINVEESTGGKASTAFDVSVNSVPPIIVRQPQNKEVIADSPATLEVTAAGSQPITYQWQFNGADIAGATGSVLSFASVRAEDEGVYKVVVKNKAGTVTSSDARLTVKVPLRITKQPVGQVVLAGANVTIVATASGRGPLKFQWRFNGADIPGETNPSLVLNSVDPTKSGNYTLQVSNADGSILSTVATLQVSAPAIITQQPQNQTAVQGGNASFNVVATGTPPPRFQWQFNGVDLSGQTGPALQLANVTVANAGEYAVVVSNPAGSITSGKATLVVSTPPAITRQPQNQNALAGATVDLNVTAGGTPPLSFQWRFKGADVAGATSQALSIPNASTAVEGDYTVVVKNAAGTVTSAPATVKITQPATITQQPQNQSAPVGGTASFSALAAGSPPLSFQWRANGVDIPGATSQTLTLAKVQASDAGSYQLLVSNAAGPVVSAVATLSVSLPVTILAQPQSLTVTNGAIATFNVVAAGSPPLSYQWRFEGGNIPGATGPNLTIPNVQIIDSGHYSVAVKNTVGEVVSAEALLGVILPPSIQTQPLSQSVNLNAAITFSVTAFGDSPLSFQWQKNGNNLPGATSQGLSIPSVQAGDQGTYTVVVQNPGGAITSIPATLSVILPQISSGKSAQDVPPPVESAEGTFDGGNNESSGGQLAKKNAPPKQGEERWFSWKAPSTGIVTFNTVGSTFDTEMTVYTGSGANLTKVANDDDSGGFFASTVKFNALQGTTYLIQVKGFGGAAGKIVVGFKLQQTAQKLPDISVQPQSQTVSSGSKVTLQVAAAGNQLSYQWFANGTAIPGATASSYVISSVREENASKYTVKVTSDSSSASPLTVESAPAIIEIGDTGSSAVDKFKSAPTLGGSSQLQSLDGNFIKNAGGSVARGYSGSQVFNTFGASKEQGEPNHCDEVGGASQWFVYQAPQDGTVRVSTEGSTFDTVLAIYTGPGTDFSSLKLEACDNNSGADGKTSVATLRVKQGTAYYVAVDGVKGATGTVKLSYEFGAGPAISTQPTNQAVALGSTVGLAVQVTNTLSSVTTTAPVLNFQWQKDGLPLRGETNRTFTLLSAQVSDLGDYAVVISNFAGSTTSAVARVSVNVPLSFTASPQSQTVKAGSPASFNASVSGTQPISYQWRLNGSDIPGATNSTFQILNVQTVNAGSYTLMAVNGAGSLESPPAILNLNQIPTITIPPADQQAVLNGSATFTVAAVGTPPLNYQWRFNGVDIPGATNAIFVINNASAGNVGEYSVIVDNNVEFVLSPSARLVLRIPLALVEEPQSQSLPVGSSAIFNVRAAGLGPFTYQWRKDGTPIGGATSPTYTRTNIQQSDTGQYTVVVTSGIDSVESKPATLTVGAAPVISQQPANQVVFAGTNVTFTVTANGSAPLSYQWFKDAVALVGATNDTLILNNVQVADAGAYSVTVSNSGGTVESNLAVLTVQQVVSGVRFDPVAGFQFRLSVPEGKSATVQVSTDLINWVDFTPTPATGIADIQDPLAATTELHFYRIIVQ